MIKSSELDFKTAGIHRTMEGVDYFDTSGIFEAVSELNPALATKEGEAPLLRLKRKQT